MKTFRMKDPSGDWMETSAPTLAKAESNLAFRLTKRPYGMYREDADSWVRGSVAEVPR